MAERRKAKKKSTGKSSAPTQGSKKADGSVSSTIFETVEKLVAESGMSRAAAFRQVAKQTGRKEGTVAVNYYYAAKKRGAKLRKRGPAAKAVGRPRAKTQGQSRVQGLLATLGELINAQAAELEQLRQESQRFTALRQMLGKL